MPKTTRAQPNHKPPGNATAHKLLESYWAFGQILRGHVIPKLIGKHGLEFKHFVALIAIHEGVQYPNQISKRLATNPSDVSRILEELHNKRFISRDLDREDSRRILLTLTKTGTKILQDAYAELEGILQRSIKDVPENQIETLGAMLDGLTSRLRQTLELEPSPLPALPDSAKPSPSKTSTTKRSQP